MGLRCQGAAIDDASIPSKSKVPILQAFHRHIYDPNWPISNKRKHLPSQVCGKSQIALRMRQWGQSIPSGRESAGMTQKRFFMQQTRTTTKMLGTFGYFDPELALVMLCSAYRCGFNLYGYI
ncbi:squalene synthase-like [Iris pallida]|uniref:Squalene synthase-like n=1 Tax=Iris pallida TaxID=29817 RepID=A0AAX6E1R3_IRIPA|nr:squalene synthase-like [Iris pallida]